MWPSNSTCDSDSPKTILFSESKKGTQVGPLFPVLSRLNQSVNLVQGEWF